MDRTHERLAVARQALLSLKALPLTETPSEIVRDAAIQRFEYTVEASWKAAQLYLRNVEGLELGSPKGVVRASLQAGVLTEAQTRIGLAMIDDRNLTVHTYNQLLAEKIYGQLALYADFMDEWLSSMEASL